MESEQARLPRRLGGSQKSIPDDLHVTDWWTGRICHRRRVDAGTRWVIGVMRISQPPGRQG